MYDIILPIESKYHNKGLFNIEDPNLNRHHFGNVAIAAAITSWSRISLDPYKRIEYNECFYSDTDSVVLEKPLDPILISKDIGKMKLEYKIEKGLFVSPKLYSLK